MGPSVGLRENVDKAAAVAKGARHHEELAHSCLVPSPPLLVSLVSLFLALQFGAILTRRLRALRLV